MKSIIKYIRESVEIYRLNEIEATYNIQPEEIVLQAPETFQESDIQQYMDDMTFHKASEQSTDIILSNWSVCLSGTKNSIPATHFR